MRSDLVVVSVAAMLSAFVVVCATCVAGAVVLWREYRDEAGR